MKTFLNVKIDKDTKTKAQRVAKELGLSVSAVVNVYLKEFVRTKRLSVSAESGYHMTPKLERELAEVEEDIKHGRNIDGPFSTEDELDRYFATPLEVLETADRKQGKAHQVSRGKHQSVPR